MVKDTVQSLKAENDKLKEKVEEVFAELKEVQENLKGNRAGGHVASASDSDALKSLDFLSKEYDDLNKFRDRTLDKISTLEKSLKQLSTEVSKVSTSKSNFKNNVNDILFQRLLKYDVYIDVLIILANFDSLV